MTKKAIIYCRVATSYQLSRSKSLDYQADLCRRYAERNGYLVVNIIKEKGSGLKINKRLLSAIKRIKNGGANILIASEPSRLARTTALFLYIKSELGKKIELLSSEGCKYTAEKEFVDRLLSEVSKFYQRKRSREVNRLQKKFK